MKTTAYHAYEVWKSRYRLNREEVTLVLQLPEGLADSVEKSLGASEGDLKRVWFKISAFVIQLKEFYMTIGVRDSLDTIIARARRRFPTFPKQTLSEVVKEAIYIQYLDMMQIPQENWSKLEYGRKPYDRADEVK